MQTDERSISTMGAWQALASDGAGYEGTVLLISTHAEEDVADLIAASPAAGFLLKAELSASAIRRVVDGSRW